MVQNLVMQGVKSQEDLLNLIPPGVAATLEPGIAKLINQASTDGSSMAKELIETIVPNTDVFPSTVPVEALKSRVLTL